MRLNLPTLLALCPIAVAGYAAAESTHRTSSPLDAEAPVVRNDTVHVAPPTGEREADRASILAALEEVEPGGTVLFALGTYLIGGSIDVTVPDVTLAGHPAGTTLRGCEPEELVDLEPLSSRCAGLDLIGARQTVRDLTFENMSWTSLQIVGGRNENGRLLPTTTGGHLIERNTFRDSDSFNVISDAAEPIVIRDNTFINTYHAIAIQGRNVHALENTVSASEPSRIPHGRADIAIGAAQFSPRGPPCADNIIAGNRIEGYPDGVGLAVFLPGTSCRGNVLRDNTISVSRVTLPPAERAVLGEEADTVVVGASVRLLNFDGVCRAAAPGAVPQCPPDASGPVAVLADNLIERNGVLGGEGFGVVIMHASNNRILDNTITGIARRDGFPSGLLRHPPHYDEGNGSGIWLSPGSNANEIAGNIFGDIASHAVVIEGDSNRAELRRTSDSVRDLGRANRVIGLNATPAAAEQAVPEWRPVASPDRASVFALAYANGTLFAGTRAGLFASDDLGASWHRRGAVSSPAGLLLTTAEGALLAGTYRQGILRSNDGGRTWSPVGFDRNIYIEGLVRDADGRIYAAVQGAVEDEPTGVFRSSDDGRTWIAAGLGTEEVHSLSLPRPGLLFAGTRQGLFRSEDGGATWSRTGALSSQAPVLTVVGAGGRLYAAMGSRLSRIPGGGVARSADGGRSWEPTQGLPPGTSVQDLVVRNGVVLAATGNVVHGGGRGLFRLDEGGSWQPAALQDVWLLSLLETPDGVFAGAYELGVFHSADGRAWSHRSAGLRNWEPTALLFDTEGLLYALSVTGLFRSADRGQSWVEMPRPEGSATPTPWSLAVDPGGDLYLAGEGGVLVSSDRGESWEARPIPGEDGQVFTVTLGRGRLFAVVRGKAAYTSDDWGRTWEVLDLPAPPRIALFASPAGARFLTAPDGTWRWSEEESWRAVAEEQVMHLTACGDALIAGSFARGLLRSTDDGRTWTPVTEDLRAGAQQAGYMTFTSIACLPGGGVLAGTFWDGVFYSEDGGATWIDVSAGLPSPTSQDFATTPDGQVFVATPAGVYTRSDPGRETTPRARPWPADVPSADTVRYTIIINGHRHGQRRMWREAADTWRHEHDGDAYHFPRTERLVLDSDGVPVALEIDGQRIVWDRWVERYGRSEGRARWTAHTQSLLGPEWSRVLDEDESALSGPAYYAALHPVHDLGVLARLLLRQPGRTISLLPDGNARLERVGERWVEVDGTRRRVRLFAIHGLDLQPSYVWLDDDEATFADEWSVLAGWEAAFPDLRSASDAALAEHHRRLARDLVPSARERPLVIRGARLFDPNTGAIAPGTTIVVEGSRISAVGPDGALDLPPDAEVVDAAGKSVLPGLWDMHAHHGFPGPYFELIAPLSLAGGITTARDVGTPTEAMLSLQRRIEVGEAVGPRVLMAGWVGGAGGRPTGTLVGNATEARAAVDRFAELGYVQIKIYSDLPHELVPVVIERAKQHGLRVSGEVPTGMTAREAVEHGYDEIQHIDGLLLPLVGTVLMELFAQPTPPRLRAVNEALVELTADSEAVQDLIRLLVSEGVAVDPTLTVFAAQGMEPPPWVARVADRFRSQARRRILDRHLFGYWPLTPLWGEILGNMTALVGALHEAGVPVLPGTDTEMAASDLHRELALYVQAGIPAPEVLTLATLGAARIMGMDDELGSIEPGKLADLILVDGDPTTDISDIRRVVTVVKDGRVYDPAALYRALGIEPCCQAQPPEAHR